jgi:seryl-tRNA synthetase
MKKLLILALCITSSSFALSQENRIEKLEFQTKQISFKVEDLNKALNQLSVKTDKQYSAVKKEINEIKKELKNIKQANLTVKNKPKDINKNIHIVAVRLANVREEPDLKSQVIAKLTYGSKVSVIGETRYFYKIKIGTLEGYIYKTLLVK